MSTRRRNRKSARIATQLFELAFAAPQVATHRLARLAVAGGSPSARDRREFHRMSAEKIAAFYESWNGMYLTLLRANLSFALWPLRFWGPYPQPGLSVLLAGLAPVHRRATANARRLRRTRIR
jgi:hypothetical protein